MRPSATTQGLFTQKNPKDPKNPNKIQRIQGIFLGGFKILSPYLGVNKPSISVFKSVFIHKILVHPKKSGKHPEKIPKNQKNPKNSKKLKNPKKSEKSEKIQ